MANADGKSNLQFLTSQNLESIPDGVALGLGLRWQSIISPQVEKEALTIALKNKATHYVHSEKVGFVGSGIVGNDAALKNKALVSLARLFTTTQHSEGIAAIALRISDDIVWVCCTQNRAVRSDSDVLVNDARAFEILTLLKQQFANIKLWGDAADLGLGLDEGINFLSLIEQLNKAVSVQFSTLKPVKQSLIQKFARQPKPIKYFCYALVAAVSYTTLIKPAFNMAYDLVFPPVVVVEDPNSMWQSALAEGYKNIRLTTPAGLSSLLTQLDALPLNVAGWSLRDVVCEAKSSDKKWLCKASFDAKSAAATNTSFEAARPRTWQMQWKNLKEAQAVFNLELVTAPLDVKSLPTKEQIYLETGTTLQTVRGLLKDNDKALSEFAAIKLIEPKFQTGMAVPVPKNIQLIQVAKLQVSGPLRTLSAMTDVHKRTSWQTLRLEHLPEAKAEKNTSKLMMTLSGDVYAKP